MLVADSSWPLLYSARETQVMSNHEQHNDFIPQEAEQNEIGGPVLVGLMVLGAIVFIIWALN